MRKELEDLAVEIVELQEKLEKVQQINKEEKLKCKLEKLKALLKISVAIGAVPLTGTALTTACGWSPFKLNDEKKTAIITTEIDKEGKISETKEYIGAFEPRDTEVKINYYSKWKKTENDNYRREVYTYKFEPNYDGDIEDYINKTLDLTKTETEITLDRTNELFPIRSRVDSYDYRAEITPEEYNAPSYVEAVIISKDNKDTVLRKETTESHAIKETFKLIIEALLMAIELTILSQQHFFYLQTYDLTRRPYLNPEEEELKKKIKTKQLLFETSPYNLPDDDVK